jgi:Mg2+-importing ATPase
MFGLLLLVFHATPETFRTAWFVESLLTELAIALVVRTRRPFFRSRPGTVLLWSSVALAGVTLVLPYLPFIGVIGLVPLPASLVVTILAVTALYVAATELLKVWFYRVRAVRVSPSPCAAEEGRPVRSVARLDYHGGSVRNRNSCK